MRIKMGVNMKKKAMFFLIAIMLTGCGRDKNVRQDSYPSTEQESIGQDTVLENESPDNERLLRAIEEQTFDITLDDWGDVTFAAIAPDGENEKDVTFKLLKNEKDVYTFPEKGIDGFEKVLAVAFKDYNEDGKTDVIAIVQYKEGDSVWNQAKVFLQENSDNMFYLDNNLNEYIFKQEAEDGPSFYRDFFLEEYLLKQKATDSVAYVMGTWQEYTEYIDELSGVISVDRQIEIFAKEIDKWALDVEYADDLYRVVLTELDYDGKLDLIVSNCGGTGVFSYNYFYEIDTEGNIKELETNFTEGSSQIDIVVETTDVYSSSSMNGIQDYYILGDLMKVAPDEYYEDIRSLSVVDNVVLETLLAYKNTTYSSENYVATSVYTDYSGNNITEEEYNNFAEKHYDEMGLQKKKAYFEWKDVRALQGLSTEEIKDMLRDSFEKSGKN